MRYAIIGTGAVGGYYGASLARAGFEVSFLLRSDYDHVAANGLQIDSFRGPFHVDNVRAYKSVADMPQCDVAIVAVKTTANHLLPQLLRPLVEAGTALLMIQNGIGIEPDLQAAMPGAELAAGLAFICATRTAPGRIRHDANGMVNICNYSIADTARIAAIADDFAKAGIKTATGDYAQGRWKKAVWNMAFNGPSVIHRTTCNELVATPEHRRQTREIMLEVIGAARALGTDIDDTFADKMIHMTEKTPDYSPSMKVDFDNRRPMEIEYLYARPVEEARKAGFAMPRTEEILRRLISEEQTERHGATAQ